MQLPQCRCRTVEVEISQIHRDAAKRLLPRGSADPSRVYHQLRKWILQHRLHCNVPVSRFNTNLYHNMLNEALYYRRKLQLLWQLIASLRSSQLDLSLGFGYGSTYPGR